MRNSKVMGTVKKRKHEQQKQKSWESQKSWVANLQEHEWPKSHE